MSLYPQYWPATVTESHFIVTESKNLTESPNELLKLQCLEYLKHLTI